MLAKRPQSRERDAMRRWGFLFLMAMATPAVVLAAPPVALGLFDRWGAIRDPATPRCYALADPAATVGTPQAQCYARLRYWPKSRIRGQLLIRLSTATISEKPG